MKSFRFLLIVLPLFLTACGVSEQEKVDYDSVQRSGVSSATYDKMLHGDALSLYDIKALTHARVSDGVILRYLRNQQTVYILNSGDVQDLSKAGVSQSIIDYMLQTPRLYQPVVYPEFGIGIDYGPGWYGYGPYYHHPYPYYHR